MSVSLNTVSIDGAQIVMAAVAGLPASDRPCRTGGRAYLRQADGDYVMSAQEEQQMLALRDRPRYDAAPLDGTSVADLDEGLVQGFLRNVRASSRRMAGARVIEGEGGGIGKAQRALADWHVEMPIFIDKGVSFTAVIMRPHSAPMENPLAGPASSVPTDWKDVPSRIVSALAEGPLDRSAIAARCRLTPSQVRYSLNKLISQGTVHMNGGVGTRSTTYSLTGPGLLA